LAVEEAERERARVGLFAKLFVVLGAVAVGLLLAEVGLRIIGFRNLVLYREDADVGYSLRPGADAAALSRALWRGEFGAWARADRPFHVKLYSVCFALFGPLLGYNVL
jgi:hypothetical protein